MQSLKRGVATREDAAVGPFYEKLRAHLPALTPLRYDIKAEPVAAEAAGVAGGSDDDE